MGLWVYGFLGFWVFGFLGFWVFGFMGLWVYGFMGLGFRVRAHIKGPIQLMLECCGVARARLTTSRQLLPWNWDFPQRSSCGTGFRVEGLGVRVEG